MTDGAPTEKCTKCNRPIKDNFDSIIGLCADCDYEHRIEMEDADHDSHDENLYEE